MPFDLTRLLPSTSELGTARTAYDAALREHAASSARAAASPRDPAAAAALRHATAALDSARTRVETARRAFDGSRLAELAGLANGNALLGAIAGDQVLGLFPVAVEAKLEPGRLRVRVWPDAISTATHDPRLTKDELDAARAYWRAEANARSEEDHRAAWRALAGTLGPTRAAWVAQATTPQNRAALAPGVEPQLPTVAMVDEQAPFVPRAAVLPDRWIVAGFRGGAAVFEQVGAPIPADLATGLDTTPSEAASLRNRDGEPIQLPPRMRWMTDFAAAKQAGMAIEVPLAAGVDHLDLLLVFGVRVTESAAQSAATLAELVTGHRYSRGLAFVPQETPTNNSAAGGAGLPTSAERVEAGFVLERQPRAFSSDESNGAVTARALGIDPALLASLAASGAAPSPSVEPDGFEPQLARAMQTVLWQVSAGAALEDFLGVEPARADALREHFRDHVRAAGPLPALRVGRQPYGLLPVTLLESFVASPQEPVDARLPAVLKSARNWWRMLRPGELYEGTVEDALRSLGRSTRVFAETTHQDVRTIGHNRWTSLAGALARASRDAIADEWRTAAVLATTEAQPQPVTRPIVDDATAAALATLASALPDAILAAAPPESLLGRVVRHAALLEWGRFARGVCEAALDATSRARLAQAAAKGGIHLYIPVVIQAMSVRVRPEVLAPRLPIHVIGREVEDIDAGEKQRIAALVGNLADPLASCPGAARLASFRRALAVLAQAPGAKLTAAFHGAMDMSNQRVDAWITSLASRRLATLREHAPQGLVLGGWGCLQDVRAAGAQSGEYIHAPSLDQAAAAAVLRSAALRANAAGSAHADIDLSSKRVRLARWLLEGVRNGRSIGELLGVRFERAIKGAPNAPQLLKNLRARFPSRTGAGVLDGVALQKANLSTTSDAVGAAAKAVDEALDALADALTAEAVFQLVTGNPGGALVDLDAVASGAAPPPSLKVTETPSTGARLTHRVAVALPAAATAPGWPSRATPRGRAEPILDAWCGLVLGPAAEIVLTVEGASAPVSLAALDCCAIDVVLAAREGGGELAERVVLAARASQPGLSGAALRGDRAWKDLLGTCGNLLRLIARAEPLRPDALEIPGALVTADEDFGDLPARAAEAETRLRALRETLARRDDAAGAVRAASAMGAHVPGLLLESAPPVAALDALGAMVEARLKTAAAADSPREKLRALFGGELPGVVSFVARDAAALAPRAELLGDDPLAAPAWLDAVGRVHPAAGALAELLQRVEIAGRAAPLRVAQAPFTDGDRWIATSFVNARTQDRAAGRLSIVMHAPVEIDFTRAVGGLLIHAWSESVPLAQRDTAMALRYNAPSTRAPQAILLAVSPDPTRPWTVQTLEAILRDTLELARLRMQPSTIFTRAGHLPQIWLGQRSDGSGISFSL